MPKRALAAAVFVALALFSCAGFSASALRADERDFGAFGPEGSRMRERLWIVPSGESGRSLRATVFRPAADSSDPDRRFPLVVINHGTDEATRLAVAMPVYYWLSRWFVERGYAVVLPQRRGHGATGGTLSEAIGTCEHPDHYDSGNVAADDIAATIDYMTKQPGIASNGVIVVGISTGGWASLALASRNLPNVEAIVNFAGGRGGHAYGQPHAVCGVDSLLEAARLYGRQAREPTVWYYSQNDSYFGPKLAQDLAMAWSGAGGSVEEHILPPYGAEGHTIADDRLGWDIWGSSLAQFLARVHNAAAGKPEIAAYPQPQQAPVIRASAGPE